MDTVGIDTFGGNALDPVICDGNMIGRGTSDCKGGVTAGLWAIKALLGVADQLQGKLIFESVVDEECNGSGAGTLACLEPATRVTWRCSSMARMTRLPWAAMAA